MGTFLKIIGIITLVFGIIVIVFTLFGMSSFLSFLTVPNFPNESTTMMPGTGWTIAGNISGAIGGFVIIISGAALYCLGDIYNNVKEMKAR
jgi:multisubunit Na+/H+ antiporter MnhG subunit